MRVIVNGDPTELADGATVAALLQELDVEGGPRGVAIAVDAEVVPRGEWKTHVVDDGANVEVVTAVQGG